MKPPSYFPQFMTMRFSSLLSLVLLLGSPAASWAQDESPLFGKVTNDNVYLSPTGAFRVPVPVLPELGGMIEDSANVVSFQDNANTHVSIACFPMDATQRWEYATREPQDYLTAFFREIVAMDFESRFPGTSVEGVFMLPNLNGGTLLVYNLLPGGSMFMDRVVITGLETLPSAKRGNLVFVKNNYVYVISIELAERILEHRSYNKTTEEENAILKTRLLDLAVKLEFTP